MSPEMVLDRSSSDRSSSDRSSSVGIASDRRRSVCQIAPDRSRAFEDAANASWLHHILPDRGKTSQIGLVPHRSEVRIAPDQSESLQLRWSQHECKQRCWVLLAWLRVAFGFLAWPCFGKFPSQKVIYGPYRPYFLWKHPYMDLTDQIFLVGSPYMDLTDQIFLVGSPYMDPKSVHFWNKSLFMDPQSVHFWVLY